MAQSRGPVDFSALTPGLLGPATTYSPVFPVHPGERISVFSVTLFKVRSHRKNTGLFGNFSQHGGGVFPIPKTFVN